MAWTWINPARRDAFDGNANVRENQGFMYLDTKESCYVVPKGNKKEYFGLYNLYIDYSSSNTIFMISTDDTNSYLKVKCNYDSKLTLTISGKDIASNVVLPTRADEKISFHIISDSTDGLFELACDGNTLFKYAGNVLNGKDIAKIIFFDGYNQSNPAWKYYWLICSEKPIPPSTSVKIVDKPTVVTDWEKIDDNTYQTSEVGKTIKISTPASEVSSGKSLLYEAAFLDKCVGGGDVVSINVKNENVDYDCVLTDKEKAIGFVAGETIFTSK